METISPTAEAVDFSRTDTVSPLVKRVLEFRTSGSALDFACGHGRNSYFLAKAGFKVTATDIDDGNLSVVQKEAQKRGLEVSTACTSMQAYTPSKPFDVVVSINGLHFLRDQEVVDVLTKMQEFTNSGGIHAVSAYTSKNEPGLRAHLFEPNELRQHYTGWEILFYTEQPTKLWRMPGSKEPQWRHAAYIIARKKK